MSKRVHLAALLLFVCPAVASAQGGSAPPPAPAAGPGLDARLSVAPEWTTGSPFAYDDVTDATSLSANLGGSQQLLGMKASFAFRPTIRLDADGDDPTGAGSSIALSTELERPLGESSFVNVAAFGSANYQLNYEDAFGPSTGTAWGLAGGLRFGRTVSTYCPYGCEDPRHAGMAAIPAIRLGGSVQYALTDSTDPLSDQDAVSAALKLRTSVKWWAVFDFEATASRRWFANVDPAVNFRQRRSDAAMAMGFDFGPAIITLFNDDWTNPVVRKLKFGYTVLNRNSNIEAKDIDGGTPSVLLEIGRKF